MMNYSFMNIFDENKKVLYSSMVEEKIFDIKSFEYFLNLAMNKFNIDLSDINYAIEVFQKCGASVTRKI